MNESKITEAELRTLRDNVYGKAISDNEWEKCRSKWYNDIEWLQHMSEVQRDLSTY